MLVPNIDGLIVAANGTLLLSQSEGSVVIFRSSDLYPLHTYYAAAALLSLTAHPTLPLAAFTDNDGRVSVLNLTSYVIDRRTNVSTAHYALSWSPDGQWLAGEFDGANLSERHVFRIISADFGSVQTLNSDGSVPFRYQWITKDGYLGLFYVGYGTSCIFQPLSGERQTFECSLAIKNQIREWLTDAQGRLIGIAAGDGQSPGVLFSAPNVTSGLESITAFINRAQQHLSVDLGSLRYATWGGTSRITLWNSRDLPVLDFDLPGAEATREPTHVVWLNQSALAVSTSTDKLILFHLSSAANGLGITLSSPQPGATIIGEMAIQGTSAPIGFAGMVVIRVDGSVWLKIPSTGTWNQSFDTGALPDGDHELAAAFSDGANYSDWVTLPFHSNNGRAPDYRPPIVWFVQPTPGEVVRGTIEAVVDAISDNTADHSVEFVELALDGGAWRRAIPSPTTWSIDFDGGGIEGGPHVLAARAYDGIGFSFVKTIEFTFIPRPGNPLLQATIDLPTDGATLAGPTAFTGAWQVANESTGWIEASIALGPWVRIADAGSGTGSWNWTFDLGRAGAHTWQFCVRARSAASFGDSDCREYHSSPGILDSPPNVTIQSLRPSVTANGPRLDAQGNASDDHGVLAVFYRVDFGDWLTAEGATNWSLSTDILQRAGGQHTLEVMAFDGFQYSEIQTNAFNESDATLNTSDFWSSVGLGLIIAAAGAVAALLLWRIRARRDPPNP